MDRQQARGHRGEVLERAGKTADASLSGAPEVHGFAREIIGRTYFQLGKYKLAEENQQRAYALRSSTLGPKNRETLESLHNLSAAQLAQAKLEEAEANLNKAVALRREAFGPDDADTLASQDLLAQLVQRKGELPAAEKIVRDWWARRRESAPHRPISKVAVVRTGIGVEKRWPLLGALAVAIAVPLLLPSRFSVGPSWILPAMTCCGPMSKQARQQQRRAAREHQRRQTQPCDFPERCRREPALTAVRTASRPARDRS